MKPPVEMDLDDLAVRHGVRYGSSSVLRAPRCAEGNTAVVVVSTHMVKGPGRSDRLSQGYRAVVLCRRAASTTQAEATRTHPAPVTW